MFTRLSLGAEVDIASGSELDAGFQEIRSMLDKDTPKPMFLVIPQAATITDPFTGTMEVGSPPTGRIWNVLGYSMCGQNDAVQSSAGTVALYIGDLPGPSAAPVPMLSQLRVPRLTIPNSATFTQKTQWCPSSQSVYVNCVGLAGLTQLVVNIFVAEWREYDIMSHSGA